MVWDSRGHRQTVHAAALGVSPRSAPHRHLRSVAEYARRARAELRQLPPEAAYLVPLRLFLGLGWLRAGAEKVLQAAWWDGSALRLFIDEQATAGLTVTLYAPFLDRLEAVAAPIGIGVMLAELMIGVAILGGIVTNRALALAMFLNVNFILAGETNPGVFYIIMALVLHASRAGCLLGWDGARRQVDLTVRPPRERIPERAVQRIVLGLAVAASLLLLPFVRALSPAQVIHDPAAVLSLLFALVALGAMLQGLRDRSPPQGRSLLAPTTPARVLPPARIPH
jgi:thiosulfate dehydrogenase (quinone) large subunit